MGVPLFNQSLQGSSGGHILQVVVLHRWELGDAGT
jgi:hypothetical protein